MGKSMTILIFIKHSIAMIGLFWGIVMTYVNFGKEFKVGHATILTGALGWTLFVAFTWFF